MKKLLVTGITLLALLGVMVGCAVDTDAEPTPRINSITAQLITGQPPIDGQQPTDNETQQQEQEGISVRIDITVSNFEVVDTIGDNVTDGEAQGDGYYIYYLNRLPAALQEAVPVFQQPDLTPIPGQEQEQQQPETAWASTDTSFTWENLPQGIHIFSVQLVDASGAPLVPPVVAAAAITVPAIQQEPNGEQPGETTINLAVDDTGYDMTEIRVPAGAEITINLQNNGQSPHGFSVYEDQFGTGNPVFAGEAVQPGTSFTYTFTAPSEAGTYYFMDDEDPLMTGTYTLIVEESSGTDNTTQPIP